MKSPQCNTEASAHYDCCAVVAAESSDLCVVASSSSFPVRETKPFNNVESCLLQEEICGGGGFTPRPTWIFSKSAFFSSSFVVFMPAWLDFLCLKDLNTTAETFGDFIAEQARQMFLAYYFFSTASSFFCLLSLLLCILDIHNSLHHFNGFTLY